MNNALRELTDRFRRAWRPAPPAVPEMPEGLRVEGSAQTDPGKERTENEDSVAWIEPAGAEMLRSRGRLAVVADGMGGAHGGAVASGLALRTIRELYFDGKQLSLEQAVERANREIYKRARRDPELKGMGAACLAVAIVGMEIRAAWVGDSRLYLVRDGSIYQLTEDHSMVAQMVRAGQITREEARNHESRNVITRALGTKARVQVDTWPAAFDARPGDRFLLCSDGIHDPLDDQEILCLMAGKRPAAAASTLIGVANERGGHDNASAVIVDFAAAAPQPLKATRVLQAMPGGKA